jgi:hypothetical protein
VDAGDGRGDAEEEDGLGEGDGPLGAGVVVARSGWSVPAVVVDGDMGGMAVLSDIDVAGAGRGVMGMGGAVGVAMAAVAGMVIVGVGEVVSGMSGVALGPAVGGSMAAAAPIVADAAMGWAVVLGFVHHASLRVTCMNHWSSPSG